MGGRMCSPRLLRTAALMSLSVMVAYGRTDRPSQTLPRPGQRGNVICAADPTQSYALYLPSAYTPEKSWPIVYFFDPVGNGRRPLDLYKDIAEKYGFIFAASNNSRNFSGEQAQSVNAMWVDTHVRLALDEQRMYASGFSGGARVAGAMAIHCPKCRVAGVIAHGAGYPAGATDTNSNLPYYFAIGDHDFNWPEVMTIRRTREQHNLPYRVRVFSGPHQWAPSSVMEDAINWMRLKAMQTGVLQRDAAFIDQYFQATQAEADENEKRNDVLGEFFAYRTLVSDFSGFKNVDDAAARLTALKKSPALKRALKDEREQIDEQLAVESGVSEKVHAYVDGSPSDPFISSAGILQAIAGLQSQAAHSATETKRLVFSRALDDIWVDGLEEGQEALEARHYAKAEACFELMKRVRDEPWPVLLLAETHAAAGNKRQAFLDLEEAVRRGLQDADAIESNPHLQVLKSDPAFQRLLARLKHD